MKLLVATDGSANALRAVAYAAQLLGKLAEPGSITLITVHDDTALQHARRFVGSKTVDEYLHELAETESLAGRELLAKAGVKHDNIVRIGHPAPEIVAAGQKGGFDMIVLGSKGHGSLREILVGSVARQLIETARLPLLLVR